MCGDSTKAEDVAKLMEGEVADLLLTDPPYNVGLGYEGCATQQRCACRSAESKTILNDKMSSSAFKDFMKNVIINAKNNIKKGAPYYIFYATSETLNVVSAVHEVQEMSLRQILIWVKDSIVMGRQDYQWKYEPCLYGWKEGAAHNFYADRKQSTILEFSRPKVSKEHPTMKPVPLFAYLMSNSTKEGEVVFDAFGGSGTTLIAAEQLNRKARLMELDPHYCDVIIQRWENLTGKKAKRISE